MNRRRLSKIFFNRFEPQRQRYTRAVSAQLCKSCTELRSRKRTRQTLVNDDSDDDQRRLGESTKQHEIGGEVNNAETGKRGIIIFI